MDSKQGMITLTPRIVCRYRDIVLLAAVVSGGADSSTVIEINQFTGAPTAWKTYNEGMEVARAAGDQHALSELAGARLELGDEEDFE